MVLDKDAAGTSAYRVTILVNLGLASAKLGVGALASSPALIADGWHSLSDVVMNALAWGGYRVSKAPPDDDHHYGHGNWEAVASLVVGLVIVGAGVGIAASVLTSEGKGTEPAHGWLAMGVAIGAGIAKLLLARHTARVGRTLNSPSLLAVSRDNLSDAMVGAVVPVAIGASLLGITWAEPACALIIACIVSWMGASSAKEGLDILMDRVEPGLRGGLEATARQVPGVHGVQRVRVHPLGSEFRVDMEISVDGSLSVTEGHAIAHSVERAVVDAHDHVVEVQVHVNPAEAIS